MRTCDACLHQRRVCSGGGALNHGIHNGLEGGAACGSACPERRRHLGRERAKAVGFACAHVQRQQVGCEARVGRADDHLRLPAVACEQQRKGGSYHAAVRLLLRAR